jgi:hypothetical protein
MQRMLNDVVVIDAVRTAFGRAGEKGILRHFMEHARRRPLCSSAQGPDCF